MPEVFAVIMAGGTGTRFWPRSKERSPKQFLEIVGEGTMIQNTLARIAPLVPPKRCLVVTNALQSEVVKTQLPELPVENILTEPFGRNTAPCIGLAAKWIQRINPNAVMVVLPADHLVRDRAEYLRVLQLAVRIADESNSLLTIGIKPSSPETGFGYIQYEDPQSGNAYAADGVYRVRTFAEKPNLETAVTFLKSGDFLWNSGMFVWKVSTILNEIEAHLPELYQQLQTIPSDVTSSNLSTSLERIYGVIRSISIDYGVMEKARTVYVVKGDFGWSDVGSWDEVVRLAPTDAEGNSIRGTAIVKDSKRNYIEAGRRLVATIGVEDLIIVATDDAILICKKGRSQDVKEIVDYIRRKQMHDYL
ncbi:MAG TPA: mannose-1-phosphate guanylyltransferase [Bacteroidota bacterium]|nr:mannose-1-phosphate guanylyltransferase [Bacteroidota bacterium]